jgi:hypothetical protein
MVPIVGQGDPSIHFAAQNTQDERGEAQQFYLLEDF